MVSFLVLTLEIKQARAFLSHPIKFLPSAILSTELAPPPKNGSNTKSFLLVKDLIVSRTKKLEKLAGYL